MTTKTLELNFQTTEGRTAKISIPEPIDPVDPVLLQQVMDTIVAKNIFNFSSGEIVTAVDARMVERTVSDIALA